MFLIKVRVQLPDGSFDWLPVVRMNSDGKGEVIKQETEKDAYEWAKYILHERVRFFEEENIEGLIGRECKEPET